MDSTTRSRLEARLRRVSPYASLVLVSIALPLGVADAQTGRFPVSPTGIAYTVLFRVMNHKSSPDQTIDLTFQKSNFAKVTIPDLPASQACGAEYVGNLPVPAKKTWYWLAVTWHYGASLPYDSVLNVPGYGDYFYMNPGSLQEAPWVKLFWDWAGYSDLRRYSGVFRIKKLVPGTYSFRVLDETGAGSTSWATSGIKAYVYRWNDTLAQPKLVAIFTPPAGAGQWWDICTITGNTVTPVNTLHD